MARLTETILRFSVCPVCAGDSEWCTACEGGGTVETPCGERPDAIVILTPEPMRIEEGGLVAPFHVRMICEPRP